MKAALAASAGGKRKLASCRFPLAERVAMPAIKPKSMAHQTFRVVRQPCCAYSLRLKHLSSLKPYSLRFTTFILLLTHTPFFQLRCGNLTMQSFRRSRVGCSTSFTTVHSSFINVHHTFTLVHKTGMKKTVKQTSDVMSYDYAPSCRTTIGAHVVRS